MAQVMTRGKVKLRFIIQWAIRSQAPMFIFETKYGEGSETKWEWVAQKL